MIFNVNGHHYGVIGGDKIMNEIEKDLQLDNNSTELNRENDELISRKAVLALARDMTLEGGVKHRCIDATQIYELPSAQQIEARKQGEWDMFELLTTAEYGKQCYFLQDDKQTVYSRISCKYMTVNDAINEWIEQVQ